MLNIEKYYNIHPGKVIRHYLAKASISQVDFAGLIGCKPQELNAIIQCRRSVPLELSLRMEPILGMEEGFIAKLQLHNNIEQIKENRKKRHTTPPDIRSILFWDTDFTRINWDRSKQFVINRVKEYGTPEEMAVITKYYEDNR